MSCTPYICEESTGSCLTSCTTDPECAPTHSCQTSSNLCLGDPGTSCRGDAECYHDACCTSVCRDLNTDLNNCGTCGLRCLNPHGTTSCAFGSCNPACDTLWADCDNNAPAGCDESLRTLENCGACGVGCAYDNAMESCATGTCTFQGCCAGWGNCDGTLANGCETSIWSPSNCGYCGYVCPDRPQATETCPAGVCEFSCDTFWHDCNGNPTDGCEVTSSHTPSNFCSSAPYLGSKCGDHRCGGICATTYWSTLAIVQGYGSYWYAARAVECSPCPGAIYMRATLTPYPGTDYDLHLFTECDHEVDRSTTGGSAVETVTYAEDDTIFVNSFDCRVKVVRRGGPQCAPWTLKLEGRSCP